MTYADGIYPDLAESDYHADRGSLSQSGAKVLLRSPARFRYELDHPSPSTDAQELGSAFHSMLLGSGPVAVPVFHDSWRTKAAQEERARLRDEGQIPLLSKDYAPLREMCDSVRAHPAAATLLDIGGVPEVSAFATDPETGVQMRARADWLRDDLVVDVKTAVDASPDGFGRAAAKFGYHQQHPWYLDVLHALGHEAQGFAFVVVEKDPPYNVGVYELVPDAVAVGRDRNRAALERFRDCRESDLWPGYPQEITSVDIPRWAYYEETA